MPMFYWDVKLASLTAYKGKGDDYGYDTRLCLGLVPSSIHFCMTFSRLLTVPLSLSLHL